MRKYRVWFTYQKGKKRHESIEEVEAEGWSSADRIIFDKYPGKEKIGKEDHRTIITKTEESCDGCNGWFDAYRPACWMMASSLYCPECRERVKATQNRASSKHIKPIKKKRKQTENGQLSLFEMNGTH